MILEVHGLVTRIVELPEGKLICIYTFEKGMLTAMLKDTKSSKTNSTIGAQLFCYSHFILYRRGDKYWIREAEILEHFFDLRRDLARTALASYVCEVVYEGATNQADIPLLRLALNTLYAIASESAPLSLLKPAFEFRCVSILGFMPDVTGCQSCGKADGNFMLYVMDGIMLCDDCRETKEFTPPEEGERRIVEIITPGVLAAMRYAIFAPLEKLFSFRLQEDDAFLFERAGECYLTNHLERGFKSLDFYHQVKD